MIRMSTPPIIIISEPDPMISGVLRVEFSRWEFAVLLALTSPEADTFALQTIANLVVLDADKDRLKAFETCARIRRRAGYAGRPIVLTCKEISIRTKAAAETAGATALLAKPYSVMDLFQAISPHLSANDPLLLTNVPRPGTAAPAVHEWKLGAAPECRSAEGSALSRNKMLLPIVRGTGTKIPVYRIN